MNNLIHAFTSEGVSSQIKEHERLIHFVINRTMGGLTLVMNESRYTGFTYEDLVQIGRIGLWKAIQDYDEEKGAFSTLATTYIYRSIRRELDNKASLVSVRQRDSIIKHASLNQKLDKSELGDFFGRSYEDDWEVKLLLEETIAQFKPGDQEIISFLIQGYNYPEMAEYYGISKSAVHMKVKRIRKEFRRLWNGSPQPTNN